MEIIKEIGQVIFSLLALFIIGPMFFPSFWRGFIANQRMRRFQKRYLGLSDSVYDIFFKLLVFMVFIYVVVNIFL